MKTTYPNKVELTKDMVDYVRLALNEQIGVLLPEDEAQLRATELNTLGVDSLDAVELVMEFEETLAMNISDEQAEGMEGKTVGELIDCLAGAYATQLNVK